MSRTRWEWLVIGGGIHGTNMALRLLERGRIRREALRIVDPSPTLLCKWRSLSARTGMQHLRSPTVHNLGSSAWTLTDFARERAEGLEIGRAHV